MKPFNLEEALAGKPVVTRDGRAVSEVVHLKTSKDKQPVRAVIDGKIYAYDIQGMYGSPSNFSVDLFMKPEKKSFWTNIYDDGCVRSHTNKELADRYADTNRIACIETVYEI